MDSTPTPPRRPQGPTIAGHTFHHHAVPPAFCLLSLSVPEETINATLLLYFRIEREIISELRERFCISLKKKNRERGILYIRGFSIRKLAILDYLV